MQRLFNKNILLLVLVCLGINVHSQSNLYSDISLIRKTRIESNTDQKTIRPYIYSEKTSVFKKYNPANIAFGGLLFFYQNALSQQFSANCLYNPSCSEFSKQSISEFGLIKGIFLSADRVMRCNRIAATGIHPLRVENNKVVDPVTFYRLKKMRILFPILFILFAFNGFAQYSISQELKFINHLINQEEYEDAIYYIDNNFKKNYPLPIRDSLNFYKGWSQYAIKNLFPSASSLLQVSSNSGFFNESRFFAAYNYSHLGKPKVSNYLLLNLKSSGRFENLKNFQLAGNALLLRNTYDFQSYLKKIDTSTDFSFSNEKDLLNKYSVEIENHRDKSMVVGGLMSAIIPGSGKIYAGKTGEGIASFLIIAATGATALENYNKLGIKNAKTIVFTSLFAVLYIGNIYGTVFTVKLVNEEFNHEMDHKILFNMHIPLRNIFN